MANGIIIIDKPAGWTSQDVVAKLRGVFHEKRVGHGGTLDPMATGVLPVFLGRATRAASYLESAEKTYVATLQLGLTTNTQDTTGEVLSQQNASVSSQVLEQVLQQFTGEQEQIPPMYSAIKIGGKKLYELARAGKEVARTPRRITIFSLELLGGADNLYQIAIHCSKGTYIRTLCHDIGQALGCGGCMASLRRTSAGTFRLDDAVALHTLLQMQEPERLACLRPVDAIFAQLPGVTIRPGQEKRCRNGAALSMPQLADGRYRVYSADGTFLMLGRQENGSLFTEKSFFEVNAL